MQRLYVYIFTILADLSKRTSGVSRTPVIRKGLTPKTEQKVSAKEDEDLPLASSHCQQSPCRTALT